MILYFVELFKLLYFVVMNRCKVVLLKFISMLIAAERYHLEAEPIYLLGGASQEY